MACHSTDLNRCIFGYIKSKVLEKKTSMNKNKMHETAEEIDANKVQRSINNIV